MRYGYTGHMAMCIDTAVVHGLQSIKNYNFLGQSAACLFKFEMFNKIFCRQVAYNVILVGSK